MDQKTTRDLRICQPNEGWRIRDDLQSKDETGFSTAPLLHTLIMRWSNLECRSVLWINPDATSYLRSSEESGEILDPTGCLDHKGRQSCLAGSFAALFSTSGQIVIAVVFTLEQKLPRLDRIDAAWSRLAGNVKPLRGPDSDGLHSRGIHQPSLGTNSCTGMLLDHSRSSSD